MSEIEKRTILYIEDQDDNAALIERILIAFGYNIVLASTGIDGIRQAIDHNPDLILIDLDLPDMSGFEVTMHLRELGDFRRTPIIAITSQDNDEYRSLARVAEMSSYLQKPINVEQLYAKIEQYMGDDKDDLLIDFNLDDDKPFVDRETFQHLVNKIRELEATNDELRTNNRELVEQLVGSLQAAEATNASLLHLDHVKDDFIQRVAHEVRTPLTVVMGYFNVLELSPQIKTIITDHEDIAYYIQAMGEGFRRMHKVVDEIVMISRLASGQVDIAMVPFMINDLITSATRPFHEAASQRDIALYIQEPSDNITLVGDVDLLRLALINLVGNAIKYTPNGGQVTLGIAYDATTISFAVQDTGVGIAPEEQERIFDRFYSADDVTLHSTSKTSFRGGGLGLGLAICKAVAEAHGGRVVVQSTGHDDTEFPGSVFYLILPLEAKQEIDRAGIYQSFNS